MNNPGASEGEHAPDKEKAGYNTNVDRIRTDEYPMLEGTIFFNNFVEVHSY